MASSAAGIGAQSTLRGRGKHFCLPEICWNFTYLPPPNFLPEFWGQMPPVPQSPTPMLRAVLKQHIDIKHGINN